MNMPSNEKSLTMTKNIKMSIRMVFLRWLAKPFGANEI